MNPVERHAPMTVGALKQALADIPDDWLVVVDDERHGAAWALGEIAEPWRLSSNADGSKDYWHDDEQNRSDYAERDEAPTFEDLPFGVVLYPDTSP